MRKLFVCVLLVSLFAMPGGADEVKWSRFSSSGNNYLVTTDTWKSELASSEISINDIEKLIRQVNSLSQQVDELKKKVDMLEKRK